MADVTPTDKDRVTVGQPEYLTKVSSLINRTPPRTVQNYMIWRFMMELAKYMSQEFREIKASFDEAFEGISEDDVPEARCGRDVNDLMGFAVSKLYIQEYFDKNARSQVI